MKDLNHIEQSMTDQDKSKSEALSACIEIFRRFNDSDIVNMGPTVRRAWLIGKKADGVSL